MVISADGQANKQMAESKPKGTIVFFHRNVDFDGNTLHERPLGGMETSIICMARELCSLGWNVKVFNHCKVPGIYDGVEYISIWDINEYLRDNITDVFISVRYLDPFLHSLNSRLKIFWTGDAYGQPYLRDLNNPQIVNAIDCFFMKSRWQAETISQYYNIPGSKFVVVKNGIDVERFELKEIRRKRGKLVYASTPFRGLDILLDMFPRIKRRVPCAELYLYTGMKVYGESDEKDREMFGHIYEKADQPGVYLVGNVTQEALAKEFLSAWLMVYPCTFKETLAGVLLEGQAAGLPVISTKRYALPEVVLDGKSGLLIEGDPREKEYQDQFVESAVRLIDDDEGWKMMSKSARQWIFEENSRQQTALEWESVFNEMLKRRRLEYSLCEHRHALKQCLSELCENPANAGIYSRLADICKGMGRSEDALFFEEKGAGVRHGNIEREQDWKL